MRKEGHIGLSLIIGSPLFTYLLYSSKIGTAILFMLIIGWLSKFPDIDIKFNHYSWIKHRGITHTFWFSIFIGIIMVGLIHSLIIYNIVDYESNMYIFIFLAGFIGNISHTIGDILTPSGVKVFPYLTDKTISFNLFNYNNKIANIGFLILSPIIILLSAYIGLNYPIEDNIILLIYISLYIIIIPLILVLSYYTNYKMEGRSMKITKYFSIKHNIILIYNKIKSILINSIKLIPILSIYVFCLIIVLSILLDTNIIIEILNI